MRVSMMLSGGARAPALAIASYVLGREGAATSAEILDRFQLSHQTLRRRRRPELERLGIVFVENGNRSMYVAHELIDQVPTKCLPR
jgi:hypothetical protein